MTEYSRLDEQEKKLGYDTAVPESFSNGYVFKDMEVLEVKTQDDEGNILNTFKQLDVTYTKENAPQASLNVSRNP